METEVSEVELDAISTQSRRLVRSLLMLIALLSVIVLWSEIHSAFGFLENISLWDVTSTVQGVESLEPITLGAVLIAILVLIITTQLVRNLPALLELVEKKQPAYADAFFRELGIDREQLLRLIALCLPENAVAMTQAEIASALPRWENNNSVRNTCYEIGTEEIRAILRQLFGNH